MSDRILLMTRPQGSSEAFVTRLKRRTLQRTEVVLSPLIDIVPTGLIPDLADLAGCIFTSAHGVALAPPGHGMAAYCVGQKTAEAAKAGGWTVAMAAPDAKELTARMVAKSGTIRGKLMHLSGRHTRGDIVGKLTVAGIRCKNCVLYDQRLKSLTSRAQQVLAGECDVVTPLFSPRTAQQFASQSASAKAAVIVAFSPAVAAPLADLSPRRIIVLSRSDRDEMTKTVENLLLGISLA